MKTYKALWVEETDAGYKQSIVDRPLSTLPDHDLLIRVHYSSLNYKDAMSFGGDKTITRSYPHQPGIDAAGVIEKSRVSQFKEGDEVIVTGFDLGMNTAGGLAEYIRVPAQWAIPRPQGLSLRDAMHFGTAGLTAALSIDKLETMGLTAEEGDIVVSGATGGVGSLAIALLASKGFSVVACTGKKKEHQKLLSIGAKSIISREELLQESKKPLLKSIYSGAIDVAGGEMLASILKQIKSGGSVACCGLVSSATLNTTVLPFILRGINLLGVDSAEISREKKQAMWQALSASAIPEKLDITNHCISLEEVPDHLRRMHKEGLQSHILVNNQQ